MPPKITREKRTAFCPVFIHKIYPQKPTEPLRLRQCIFAPPPDIVYGVWGDALFVSAPPLDPFGISGYGAHRGRRKYYTDLSSRDWRNAPKRQTGFELDRCPQHLCDSTVAPPLPFPVHALWICGRKWGGENGPAEHYIKGALRVTRSSPKALGDLN